MKTIMRREYSGITATMLGFIFVAYLREYFITEEWPTSMNYVYWTAGALLISLIFRTLKKSTKLLYEEDRS
jgi:hypothetical protein